jgi:hypothetical protein
MTRQTIRSFLIRLEDDDGGARSGTVTSVQTGEHEPFATFADLAAILERWSADRAPHSEEETR